MVKLPPGQKYVRGKRLKDRRERLGYTQGQLSEYTGVSQGHISNIERGFVTIVGSEVLAKLADKLRTNVSYLIGESEDPRPPDTYEPGDLTPDEEDLLRTYRKIQILALRETVLSAARSQLEADELLRRQGATPTAP